jgi:hypothetical protein
MAVARHARRAVLREVRSTVEPCTLALEPPAGFRDQAR